MMRAIYNGVVIAETPRTKRVEGNDYFPPASLNREYFTESPAKSLCFWKGVARYYTITVSGSVAPDAAWYYPHPSPLARHIKNHVAFGYGVIVEGTREKKPAQT
ncbi:DUF427 domain-containing protein [Streptomyces sp. NPDC002851]